jgi:hypothetical protein
MRLGQGNRPGASPLDSHLVGGWGTDRWVQVYAPFRSLHPCSQTGELAGQPQAGQEIQLAGSSAPWL